MDRLSDLVVEILLPARLVLQGHLVAHGAPVRGHPAGRGRAQRAAVRLLRVRPPHERQPRILNSTQDINNNKINCQR